MYKRPHYNSGGVEAIDVIEAFELGFHLGSVVKYVLRAGRKGDALKDLRKAKYFLDREIARRQAGAVQGEMPTTMEIDVTSMDDVARRIMKVVFDTPIPTTGNVVVSEASSEQQEYNG
jgi:hypothetical protein